jgi:hypothetical protein
LLLLGCVNLDKPENVRNCAGTPQGCSDDPTPTPKSDASDGQKVSDVKLEDGNGTPDLPPGSPDAGPDRFSSPDVADAIIRRDTMIDGGPVDVEGAQADLLLDLPVLPDGPSLDEGGELDLGKADLPTPDAADTADAVADLPSADLTVDVTVLDTTPDVQVNCVAQIVSNGYKAGTAPACSECRENGLSLAAKCSAMIDCLAPKPAPRSSNVFMECRNQVGGSIPVGDCATVLVKAGCPNGY